MSGLKKYYSQLQQDCQRVNNIAALSPALINNSAIYSLLASKYYSANEKGICVESRKLTIGTDTHFSVAPKGYQSQKGIPVKRRKRISATIIKGQKKKFSHGFILNPDKVKNGAKVMLWGRDGKEPPKPIKSTSAAEMANQKEIAETTEKVMSETFENRLHHYVEREMNKIANH